MRLAVTGLSGQAVSAMLERAPRCDVIVNAAVYAAVDNAKSESGVVTRVKGDGAGHVGAVAANLLTPLSHLSADEVFDGARNRPCRGDATAPTGASARSPLGGEQKLAPAVVSAIATADDPTLARRPGNARLDVPSLPKRSM
jgi:dTDP-4-dehydrorhamnose reductase